MDWFLPLFLFMVVAIFTPGPNNILAMSIGFNWGFKRVIPHILGVTVGFPIMLLLVGFLMHSVLKEYAAVFEALKYLSLLYILYLAYKIATAPTTIEESDVKKPITFLESVAFQWINPKGWAGALATITLYIPKENYSQKLIITAAAFAIIIIFAVSLWGYIGKKIKLFLSNPKEVKLFNYAMAVLLVLSVLMIFF